MRTCSMCKNWFPIPEKYPDYEEGKGDCVLEHEDDKGKWWTAKVVDGKNNADQCPHFSPKLETV